MNIISRISIVLFVSFISATIVVCDSNVRDEPLQHCSTAGMAITGYERGGKCTSTAGDHGSHHICIDISSSSLSGGNFCTVTEQSDWCSEEHDCTGGGKCGIKNWCVCQWAFASYIKKAGGCDKIQTLVCDATSHKALEAYQSDEKYSDALACLRSKCNLSDSS